MVRSQVSSCGDLLHPRLPGGAAGTATTATKCGGGSRSSVTGRYWSSNSPHSSPPNGEEDSLQRSQSDVGSVGLRDPAFRGGGGSGGRSHTGTTVKRRNGPGGGGASAALRDLRAESDHILRDVEGLSRDLYPPPPPPPDPFEFGAGGVRGGRGGRGRGGAADPWIKARGSEDGGGGGDNNDEDDSTTTTRRGKGGREYW